jgi:hypothetical protein
LAKLEKLADKDDTVVAKLEKRITSLEKQANNLKKKI